MKKRIIAIVANGEELNLKLVKHILNDVTTIIAANGGASLCKEYGIKPDYIIGDVDSIPQEVQDIFSSSKIILEPDQELTDLQKALNFAQALSPNKIKILSSFGKRMDHSIGNLIIFSKYYGKASLEIYDNFGKTELYTPGKHKIKGKIGQTISFFSLSPIKNLFLTGFQFPIKNKNYDIKFVGISNTFKSEIGSVEFTEGKLFSYTVY